MPPRHFRIMIVNFANCYQLLVSNEKLRKCPKITCAISVINKAEVCCSIYVAVQNDQHMTFKYREIGLLRVPEALSRYCEVICRRMKSFDCA